MSTKVVRFPMAAHKKQPKSPIKGVRFKRDILGAIAEYGEYEGIEGFSGQLRSLVVKALRAWKSETAGRKAA